MFEFVIDGPPVSQQTRRRHRYREWIERIRGFAEAAWPTGAPPLTGPLEVTILYFFEGAATDVDNVIKPIHDAMTGLVYGDDMEVSDSVARRRDLLGQFTIQNLTPTLTEGLSREREFLYVAVRPAPTDGINR
jgi:crossover junction endodeoxyribonuclease RusA